MWNFSFTVEFEHPEKFCERIPQSTWYHQGQNSEGACPSLEKEGKNEKHCRAQRGAHPKG